VRREKEKRGRVKVRVFSDCDREEESSREVGEANLAFFSCFLFVCLIKLEKYAWGSLILSLFSFYVCIC